MRIDKKKAIRKIKQAQKKVTKVEDLVMKCDECEHLWTLTDEAIKSKEIEIDRGKGTTEKVEHRYFSCPKCLTKYTTYVGNSTSEKFIAQRNEIRSELRKLRTKRVYDRKRYFELMAADSKLEKSIKEISAKLKQELGIDGKAQ